jgi:hypothetical protein
MLQSLREAVPLVGQAIASSIVPSTDPPKLRQLQSALKCLEAWIPNLPSKYAPIVLRNVTPAASPSNAVLQRLDTPSTPLVLAPRPNIGYFPTHRFCRLGCAVFPRFCGRSRLRHVDVSAPPMVRTSRPIHSKQGRRGWP